MILGHQEKILHEDIMIYLKPERRILKHFCMFYF